MCTITDNQKSSQQKSNTTLPTLLYVDPDLLMFSEKEQLSQIFKFIENFGNSNICNKVFTSNRKEFPCLIERKDGPTYLTVWNKHPSSYNPNNRIIGSKSYIEFIIALIFWLNKDHPKWLELLSKEDFVKDIPIQSLIKNSKGNENRLQDKSSTRHKCNPRGSVIDGGRTEASIAVKHLSNKTILG